jgi:DNA topoisomerase VI subunit A
VTVRPGPVLLVLQQLTPTEARGYPDLATRSFLRSMIDTTQYTGPLFGLFDYDAYGIDILKCYLVGSKATAGEKMLALPEMRWVGVKGGDILGLVSDTMPLTQGDRAKAHKLLEGMLLRGMPVPELADCVHELQRMLMLGRKAEIQALESDGGQLGRFLEKKMLMEM